MSSDTYARIEQDDDGSFFVTEWRDISVRGYAAPTYLDYVVRDEVGYVDIVGSDFRTESEARAAASGMGLEVQE